jgi:hypothetical protein
MPASKRLADVLTLSRLLNTLGLIVVAFLGQAGLVWAAVLVVIAWTTDSLDGPLARRHSPPLRSWIGDHDLEIDMSVAGALLCYLALSGFLDYRLALGYALFWAFVLWRGGEGFVSTRLCQAPIYLAFLVVLFRQRPDIGRLILLWMVAAMAAGWPRFSRVTVPSYLRQLRGLFGSGRNLGR